MAPDPKKLLLEVRLSIGGGSIDLWDTTSGGLDPLCSSAWNSEQIEIGTLSSEIQTYIQVTNLKGREKDSKEDLEILSGRLTELVLAPEVRQTLRHSTAEFLTFSLERSVLHIPWELLSDGKDFLCCRFSLGRHLREPRMEGQKNKRLPRERTSIAVLADPQCSLPAAAREGDDLYRFFIETPKLEPHLLKGPVSFEDVEATLKGFDIVHFCGHGESDPNCFGETGWKVVESTFQSTDILQMARKGILLPRLVFSNACQTALPLRNDFHSPHSDSPNPSTAIEPLSLGEAFLSGGSSYFVGAISDLLDNTSWSFAKAFYSRVLEGVAIGSALRLARLDLRSMNSAADLTWSQYVLYGVPDTGLYGETTTSVETRTIFLAKTIDSPFLENSETRPRQTRMMGKLIGQVRELLLAFPDASEGSFEEGAVCIFFPSPSAAVRFSLVLGARVDRLSQPITEQDSPTYSVGISTGEVYVERTEGTTTKIHGRPIRIARKLLEVAQANQILLGRNVFDNARATLGIQEMDQVGEIAWFDHGAYRFKDFEEPIGVSEVGRKGSAPLTPPRDSEIVRRFIPMDQEPVLGWRPALDSEVPTSPRWFLIEKLGEGGFGEVWRAKHKHSGSTRVFKFCFKADRVRSLKRGSSPKGVGREMS